MKKVTYEKWVSTFVQNLSSHFNLAGWSIKVEFCPDCKEDSEGCWAEVVTDSVYMQTTLRVYPKIQDSWTKGDTDRVVEVLTHEFSHILVDPLHDHAVPFLSDVTRPAFMNILENVTQRTAMVILNGLPKNLIPPR